MKQASALRIKNKTQIDLSDKALKNLSALSLHLLAKQHLTGTEDAQLLSGRYEVEMCGEKVHERTRIHHKHKHTEAIYPNLLPVRRGRKCYMVQI